MTREIMKEIEGLILKGHSGRELQAMGYTESTVRAVGDRMALRGELPGIETIRKELLREDNAEVLKQIRWELRERGFKKGSIDAVVSELRRKGEFAFERPQAASHRKTIAYNPTVAQLWEEYREKKAHLLKEHNEKVAQLLRQYEEKTARKKRVAKDEVKRLQAEIEARDRLLKKLIGRLSEQRESEEDIP